MPDWIAAPVAVRQGTYDPPTPLVLTVATLPVAALSGGIAAVVTDATATTRDSIVAGGGANRVPVYSDGTNWRIGQ